MSESWRVALPERLFCPREVETGAEYGCTPRICSQVSVLKEEREEGKAGGEEMERRNRSEKGEERKRKLDC